MMSAWDWFRSKTSSDSAGASCDSDSTMAASRTGVDRVTISILECLDELDARPEGRYVKSARVVEHASSSLMIPPRYVYEAMCANAAHWLTQLPLVDIHGNIGSADNGDEPASPRYTEARMTYAGWTTLAAERGELPRLPVGLINGDLAFGGAAPPFDPARVASALHAAVNGASDAEIVELVGLPSFRIACSVDGDLAELASGTSSTLRLRARVEIESDEHENRLVISHLPWGIGPQDASRALANRVDAEADRDPSARQPDLFDRMRVLLRDIRNESHDCLARVVCELEPGADPEVCRDRVLETWPVTTRVRVQLGAPLAQRLHQIIDGSDAQQETITALIAS
jgi:DNA gyrase/topoisomerase IV subunit A